MDEKFIELARSVAANSTCLGVKVGAVVAKGDRVLALGWNTHPTGVEPCDLRGYCSELDHTCLTQQAASRAIHAEVLALGSAAQVGLSCKGATLYVTHRPCFNCLKSAVAHGIVRVVWVGDEYSPLSAIALWCDGVIQLSRLGQSQPNIVESQQII